MTPGPVDLKIVRDRLVLLDQSLIDLQSLPHTSLDEFTADRRNVLAADAALRRGSLARSEAQGRTMAWASRTKKALHSRQSKGSSIRGIGSRSASSK